MKGFQSSKRKKTFLEAKGFQFAQIWTNNFWSLYFSVFFFFCDDICVCTFSPLSNVLQSMSLLCYRRYYLIGRKRRESREAVQSFGQFLILKVLGFDATQKFNAENRKELPRKISKKKPSGNEYCIKPSRGLP